MKPRLLVVGAGGHARVVINIARRMDCWDLVAILAREVPVEPELIDGVPIVGTYAEAASFLAEGWKHAVLAIGDNDERATLHSRLGLFGYVFPVLTHPWALIEKNAIVGDGTVVCAGAIVGTQVVVGRNSIINTGAIIDHETITGDHVHVAPGCRIAGRVRIGEGAMLGIGTCVRDKIRIGARALIGAGSVVVDDISADVVAYGSPARVARRRKL